MMFYAATCSYPLVHSLALSASIIRRSQRNNITELPIYRQELGGRSNADISHRRKARCGSGDPANRR
jgi:hypothetical protein